MVTRACYFLECAHFVHQCNRGQWPTWLKMNLPVFRPSKPGNNCLNAQSMVQRRTQILQLQATKMFYQWAEVRNQRRYTTWNLLKMQSFRGSSHSHFKLGIFWRRKCESARARTCTHSLTHLAGWQAGKRKVLLLVKQKKEERVFRDDHSSLIGSQITASSSFTISARCFYLLNLLDWVMNQSFISMQY